MFNGATKQKFLRKENRKAVDEAVQIQSLPPSVTRALPPDPKKIQQVGPRAFSVKLKTKLSSLDDVFDWKDSPTKPKPTSLKVKFPVKLVLEHLQQLSIKK